MQASGYSLPPRRLTAVPKSATFLLFQRLGLKLNKRLRSGCRARWISLAAKQCENYRQQRLTCQPAAIHCRSGLQFKTRISKIPMAARTCESKIHMADSVRVRYPWQTV